MNMHVRVSVTMVTNCPTLHVQTRNKNVVVVMVVALTRKTDPGMANVCL